MVTRDYVKAIVLMMTFGVSTSASASFQCKVEINNVLIYSNGKVNVRHSGRGDYTVICSLKDERKGVSIATCALWASLLSGYEKDNKRAVFYYDTTPDYSSCAELPVYSLAPAPVYIGNAD